MNDNEMIRLIELAAAGDESAFERLMEKKAKQILYFSVKLLKNWQDGEDVAQEVMLSMYQHIDELKSPEAFNTWMYKITTRTCINYQKKWGKEEAEPLDAKEEELNEMRREFLPQEYIEDVDKRDFLMKIIDGLPENYRACLLLFYYEDMSYQDIADALDVSVKRVANILVRAKQLIRERLERRYGGKINFSSFQGAVAMPVLSRMFQEEAASRIAPEIVGRLIADSGIGALSAGNIIGSSAASGTAAGSGASGSAAASGTSTGSGASVGSSGSAGSTVANSAVGQGSAVAGGMNTTAKIVIGLVTATAAAGTAYHAAPGALDFLNAAAARAEETAILTLEDMIGEERAAALRDYVTGEVEPAEWEAFLSDVSPSAIYTADGGDERYTLYHLEKQDKQLMILELNQEGNLTLAYRFTDSHEAAPRELEFLDSLERWR